MKHIVQCLNGLKAHSALTPRVVGLLGVLVAAILLFGGMAQAAGTGWSMVASPNPSTMGNTLQSVAAVSPNKVWAVGYSVTGTTKNNMVKRTLVERFNGTGWHVVSSPNVGTGDNVLTGVAVISEKDAWAVGSSPNGGLILHFDGLRWRIFSAPSACLFNAVTATSASDLWAVGTIYLQSCAEHFDGSSWTLAHTPTMGSSDNTLLGVAASSSTNVWAVGMYCIGNACDHGGGVFQTMIFHYDSSLRWSVVASPNPSSYLNQLNAVTVISAKDAWAVGNYGTQNPNSITTAPLIEHFDGSSWTQAVSASVPGSSGLAGIAAASATDIYAVGSTYMTNPSSSPTIIEHFDGNTWSTVTSPSPGTYAVLNSVVHVPNAPLGSAQYWAAGAYNNSAPSFTLTERDI